MALVLLGRVRRNELRRDGFEVAHRASETRMITQIYKSKKFEREDEMSLWRYGLVRSVADFVHDVVTHDRLTGVTEATTLAPEQVRFSRWR